MSKFSDDEKEVLLNTKPIPFYQLSDENNKMSEQLQNLNKVIFENYITTLDSYEDNIDNIENMITDSLKNLKDAIKSLGTQ